MNSYNLKETRFKELAESRLNKALSAIDIIGNLSNRSAYQYTESEVGQLFRSIEEKSRQVESLFKFEDKISVQNSCEGMTWKELAAGLYEYGVNRNEFSKVQWGQNCIKFFIKRSSVWFTCYALHFKKQQDRTYGIFLSYPGYWNEGPVEFAELGELKSILSKNEQKLREDLPEITISEHGEEDDSVLAIESRSASSFGNDLEAFEWLHENLDKLTLSVVPLINKM